MKAKLFTLLGIIIVCALAMSFDLWAEQQTPVIKVAEMTPRFESVPEITFSALDKQSYKLKDLPEKVILLHFWASWCVPCHREFPALLQRIIQARGELALVAVSIDDDKEAMQRFITQLNLKSPADVYWVWDKDKTISLKSFNTAEVPETVLIDATRLMVEKIVGDPNWDSQEMKTHLDHLTKALQQTE